MNLAIKELPSNYVHPCGNTCCSTWGLYENGKLVVIEHTKLAAEQLLFAIKVNEYRKNLKQIKKVN